MISESDNYQGNLIQSIYSANPDLEKTYKIKKIKFAMNEAQREELLKIAYERNFKHGLMIKTQLELGLRVNELVNMGIEQINFNQRLIIINSREGSKYLKAFKTKTKSSNRIIPLGYKLAKELKAYIGNRKTGYVFVSNKGGGFIKNSVIDFINKYSNLCVSLPVNQKGNKNIGSHILRRTFASYIINNGITIDKLSKVLGHASIRTTMLYLFDITTLDFDDMTKVIDKMNKNSQKYKPKMRIQENKTRGIVNKKAINEFVDEWGNKL
ncbi:Tyrosine recombinase XerC [Candidatus Lokiarchaeum ossiferum]|uniref:Tyrosine recombinase XerC n=1 Tax=Candidatus Lokiarchaeum ossiferum TaxID=2951803 RepID=A0ABY6HX70_9ARCH|nr:Tyrosine recombinase XerC [Candidatus Lokiarchaeum sp. B-35]